MKTQDTGKFRENTKDKFYTNVKVAQKCIANILAHVSEPNNYVWLEPSAGTGAFYNNIPIPLEKIGLDTEPYAEGIKKMDFHDWSPNPEKKYVVLGNPPFGRQSSQAKAFIKKSCKFATIIAFILPKSFTKPSMNNAFARNFHLVHCEDLQKKSFILNETAYDVPCVFQIWQNKTFHRNIEKKIAPVGFEYVKNTEEYHLAFRRVGGLAGKSYKNNGSNYSVQSHHFIKLSNSDICDTLIEKINQHEFPSNTVGARSLSKHEINSVVNTLITTVSSS